jgi:hypothetical protein
MINDPPQIKSYNRTIGTNSGFNSANILAVPGTAVYVQITNLEPAGDSNAAIAVRIDGDPASTFEIQPGVTQIFNRGEIAATQIDFANVSASGGGGTAISLEIILSVVQG